jgi:serine/threonine-protein kinase
LPSDRKPLNETLTVLGDPPLVRSAPEAGGHGAASEAPPGIPAPGETVAAKYVVERLLGQGGMGVVLAARHAQLGKLVAIKVLDDGKAGAEKTAVARFLREARAAAQLSSEHIAKVHDIGTLESGRPYLVMDYLEGADLGQVLRTQGALPIPDAVDAILQACEGLAEAHAHGIIHRDLKPSNLFVTRRPDGTPLLKILDFGISKIAEAAGSEQPSLTATGLAIGSPFYMSPEQIRSARDVDERSDIWALGVVLYELLAGAGPFAAATTGETFAKIFSEPPPPLRARRPDVPDELSAVIQHCLERDVRRRVQNVGELVSKLLPFGRGGMALSVERSQGAAPPSVPAGAETVTFGAAVSLKSAPRTRATRRATPAIVLTVAGALLVAAALTYALRPRPGPAVPHATGPNATAASAALGRQTAAGSAQTAIRLTELPPAVPIAAPIERAAPPPARKPARPAPGSSGGLLDLNPK